MRVTDEMVVAALNANQVKDFEQRGFNRKPEWGEFEDWHPDDVERMRATLEATLASPTQDEGGVTISELGPEVLLAEFEKHYLVPHDDPYFDMRSLLDGLAAVAALAAPASVAADPDEMIECENPDCPVTLYARGSREYDPTAGKCPTCLATPASAELECWCTTQERTDGHVNNCPSKPAEPSEDGREDATLEEQAMHYARRVIMGGSNFAQDMRRQVADAWLAGESATSKPAPVSRDAEQHRDCDYGEGYEAGMKAALGDGCEKCYGRTCPDCEAKDADRTELIAEAKRHAEYHSEKGLHVTGDLIRRLVAAYEEATK